MKPKLWTRDFTLLISATVLGAAGGIAGSFALSFLVYEETGSINKDVTIRITVHEPIDTALLDRKEQAELNQRLEETIKKAVN